MIKRTHITLALLTLPLLASCGTDTSGDGGGGGGSPALAGTSLAEEVAQVRAYHNAITCEDVPVLEAGAVSDCYPSDDPNGHLAWRVTFDDAQGHFTVVRVFRR